MDKEEKVFGRDEDVPRPEEYQFNRAAGEESNDGPPKSLSEVLRGIYSRSWLSIVLEGISSSPSEKTFAGLLARKEKLNRDWAKLAPSDAEIAANRLMGNCPDVLSVIHQSMKVLQTLPPEKLHEKLEAMKAAFGDGAYQSPDPIFPEIKISEFLDWVSQQYGELTAFCFGAAYKNSDIRNDSPHAVLHECQDAMETGACSPWGDKMINGAHAR